MSTSQTETRFTPYQPYNSVITKNPIHRDEIVGMLECMSESERFTTSDKKELESTYSIVIIADNAIKNMMSSF